MGAGPGLHLEHDRILSLSGGNLHLASQIDLFSRIDSRENDEPTEIRRPMLEHGLAGGNVCKDFNSSGQGVSDQRHQVAAGLEKAGLVALIVVAASLVTDEFLLGHHS